jgi:hypothetical protein
VTYALFDDAGKFLAGRVMSEAESSVQIELDSGKRVKAKAANVLLRFEKPAPAELIAAAQKLAQDIDLDLAWEFAPEDEFGFADLARDYFDAKAGAEQLAAALFRLFEAPHYFRRAGKGRFKKAPEEIVKAALLGIERKKQIAAQIEAWAGEIAAGQCPPPVREQLYRILFKPDKNAPEYKAVVEAARAHAAFAAGPAADRRRHRQSLPVPLEALPVRAVPAGHGFPGAGGTGHQGRTAAGCVPGVFHRRLGTPPRSTTRCRCRAWARARWCSASTSPRRRWPSSPTPRSTRWRASACPRSTCRAGS